MRSIKDARDIRDGGGNSRGLGRNTFQRPRDEALAMLDKLVRIYKAQKSERRAGHRSTRGYRRCRCHRHDRLAGVRPRGGE